MAKRIIHGLDNRLAPLIEAMRKWLLTLETTTEVISLAAIRLHLTESSLDFRTNVCRRAPFPVTAEATQSFEYFGQPEDIANEVISLASDRSLFMTGSEFTVDGDLPVR